ncbi:MAG: hypothetical protein SPK32_04145 [Bacteroidaceae bacterium]|nr:hypothetical protein [Bacteroidaceae bacterium]
MYYISKFFLGLAALTAVSFMSCSDDDCDKKGGSGNGSLPLSQVNTPKRNPYLAAEHYSITHFNSAQTDAFPYAVADGTFRVDPMQAEGGWSGPVNLMTLSAAVDGYMWGMSSDRVSYYRTSNGAFTKLGEAGLPSGTMKTDEQLRILTDKYENVSDLYNAIVPFLGTNPMFAIASGNYVLCDKDNYAYSNIGTTIARYCLVDPKNPDAGIKLDKQFDVQGSVGGAKSLVGVIMSYDGHLVVAYNKGIAIVDRNLTQVIDSYQLPADQVLSNSISIDEHNGIYLASNSNVENGKGLMQKIILKNGKLSTSEADGAWQSAYDGGPMAPSIKMGYGTGSTPTLMGFGDDEDKLVVITDGAKRMKIVAFWRDNIPSDAKEVVAGNPRIAGVRPITCGLPESTEWIQSEQSVACAGYGAFVVNNILSGGATTGDKVVDVLAIGPLIETPRGAERLQWNTAENCWETVWTRADISSPSMIPAISTTSEMVFVNGYSQADGWEVTGLDWNTGETRHRVIFGDTSRGNGTYAIIQYLENGDLLFNSVSGPFRVKLKP